MDYGFHAPTVSFPVAGTLMVEPTESEAKDELDRFCDAMIAIRARDSGGHRRQGRSEGQRAEERAAHRRRRSPADDWTHPYSREQAAFPLPFVRAQQVLAERRTDRQPVRRPQPDVLLPARRRIRVIVPERGGFSDRSARASIRVIQERAASAGARASRSEREALAERHAIRSPEGSRPFRSSHDSRSFRTYSEFRNATSWFFWFVLSPR